MRVFWASFKKLEEISTTPLKEGSSFFTSQTIGNQLASGMMPS